MMRCEHCGGHANPGLAHLHGNPCQHLCVTCTRRLLERQELERQADEAAQKAAQEIRRTVLNRSLQRAA
jgi:hypothetical protein